MKVFRLIFCGVMATLAIAFSGCSPEELTISISTRAIRKAQAGEIATAEVTAIFDASMDDAKANFSKIRNAVLPYLGDNARMTLKKDKIIATFTISILPEGVTNVPGRLPICLTLRDGKLKVVETPMLKRMNRDLNNIDFSLEADLKAQSMIFSIEGDCSDAPVVTATAAFVDSTPYVTYRESIPARHSTQIEFRCGDDSSIYKQITPFIEVK